MAADPAGRPNVLLVIADQWSGTRLGSAGHPTVQTPTLDQLARNGVTYTRAYSESPICIPARRSLYTGLSPRSHGDRVFRKSGRMPDAPTLAGSFRAAGYQAFCVGKLHVYPERDRIGYDDVLLSEEGRPHLAIDDHDLYLSDHGFTGRQFVHGMPNNAYLHRPWHLPEHCHVTNWATMELCRFIKRRDPTRPAFWTLSYQPPHPPLTPLAHTMDYYRQFPIEPPLAGDWSADPEALPNALKAVRNYWPALSPIALAEARRAYYAACTHIDHQLRVVIGTLREERLLDDTIILFTSDHGDMLGDFGLFGKRLFYEPSARVPMILVGRPGDRRLPAGTQDDRLVCLADVMPTLLDLAGVPAPSGLDGLSAVGERRGALYGEVLENDGASRMIHDGRHKLIWYPAGNRVQLFDLAEDPDETTDRAAAPEYAGTRARLAEELASRCHGIDVERGWVREGTLAGYDPGPYRAKADRTFAAQRGLHYPQPPAGSVADSVGFPD